MGSVKTQESTKLTETVKCFGPGSDRGRVGGRDTAGRLCAGRAEQGVFVFSTGRLCLFQRMICCV